jgi:hypothetical protein
MNTEFYIFLCGQEKNCGQEKCNGYVLFADNRYVLKDFVGVSCGYCEARNLQLKEITLLEKILEVLKK